MTNLEYLALYLTLFTLIQLGIIFYMIAMIKKLHKLTERHNCLQSNFNSFSDMYFDNEKIT